eukprot:6548851-Karenia_brevis.AAC.2
MRCANPGCSVRPWVKQAWLAFTPLHSYARGGSHCLVDYQMVLRCAFALGDKLANDSAVHMVRREATSVRTAEQM